MTGRDIKLGSGRLVTLGQYVRAWKRCLSLSPETFIGVCPDGLDGRAKDALRQFRAGMHERINRHDPAYFRGRKWSGEYQREMVAAASHINGIGKPVDWLNHGVSMADDREVRRAARAERKERRRAIREFAMRQSRGRRWAGDERI